MKELKDLTLPEIEKEIENREDLINELELEINEYRDLYFTKIELLNMG